MEDRLAQAHERLQRARAELREVQAQNHVQRRKLYDAQHGVEAEFPIK